MGSDLNLANRVFFLTKELAREMHKTDELIDYYTAVYGSDSSYGAPSEHTASGGNRERDLGGQARIVS